MLGPTSRFRDGVPVQPVPCDAFLPGTLQYAPPGRLPTKAGSRSEADRRRDLPRRGLDYWRTLIAKHRSSADTGYR
jgi:hypothetical protein